MARHYDYSGMTAIQAQALKDQRERDDRAAVASGNVDTNSALYRHAKLNGWDLGGKDELHGPARANAVARDAARTDAGPRVDPRVRGVDHPRKVVVRENARRQVAAGAGHDGAESGFVHGRAGPGAAGAAVSPARRRSSSARLSVIFRATSCRTHSAETRIAW